MTKLTTRGPSTLLALLGALVATLTAQASGSPLIGLGLAILAGLALSLMLYGAALRVLACLITALAVLSAGWAGQLAQWIVVAGFVVVAVAGLGVAWWGPRWQRRSKEKAVRLDTWAAIDAGEDPTAVGEQESPGRSGSL